MGMDCWHCKANLVWGGDHDCDQEDEFDIVTNLTCPECVTHVWVYHSFERNEAINDRPTET